MQLKISLAFSMPQNEFIGNLQTSPLCLENSYLNGLSLTYATNCTVRVIHWLN